MRDRVRLLTERLRVWFADLLFSCATWLSHGEWRSPEIAELRRQNMLLRQASARWQFRSERLNLLVREWQKRAKAAKAGIAVERTPVHVDVRIN